MRFSTPGFMPPSPLRIALVLAFMLLSLIASGVGQTLSQPTVIPTGNWPAAIYTADVNGDGYPDLIYIDQGALPSKPSTTHVLLNDGHGSFHESARLDTIGSSLAIGDLTASGHVSIGWVTFTATGAPTGQVPYNYFVTTAAGRGDGTFSAATATQFVPTNFAGGIPVTPVFDFVTAVHLYPTGPMDVFAENTANSTVFDFSLQNFGGTPRFTGISLTDFNAAPGPMTFADVNGDGLPDMILDDQTNLTANVFLNTRVNYGRILQPANVAVPNVRSLLVKDVNNDGRPDLIAEGTNGRIDIFPGNGDGTFGTTSIGGSAPLDGLTGNGGHLIALNTLPLYSQLLTATPVGISSTLTSLSGNASGLKGIYNAGPGRTSYAVADFNNDGTPDLAVDSPEGIAILYGASDGSFSTNQAFAAGKPAMSGALAAFTSSGNVDAVVSTGAAQAQFLRGLGNGLFLYAGAPGAPTPTSSQSGPPGLWSVVQAGDLDSDGHQDLLLTADGPAALLPKTPDGAQVALGNGDGTFAAALPLTTPFGNSSCQQAPGLFYGTATLGNNLLGAVMDLRSFDGIRYFYNGNHHFPSSHNYQRNVSPLSPCGPCAHNLTLSPNFISPKVSDVISQGDGHLFVYFTLPQNFALRGAPDGDFSVDGSLTTPGQLTAPALSPVFNGPAIPVSAGGLGFPAFLGSMASADLDRDGNVDLLAVYANLAADRTAPTPAAPNFLYIWYGSGNGKFLTSAKHPVNPVRVQLSRNYYQVAVADLNDDGIPDLILSDGLIVSIQNGLGDGTFGPETHYLAGQGINSLSVADVNHDGKLDLVVANGGTLLSNPVANLDQPFPVQSVPTGGITVLLNQTTKQSPTGVLSISPEPSAYGTPFSLTASLSQVGGTTTPSGSVDFTIDGVAAGTGTLAAGSATVVVPPSIYSTLAPGSHAVGANYSGDALFQTLSFGQPHIVSRAPTSVNLRLCVDPPGSLYPCGVPIETTALISPIMFYFGQSLDGVAIESANDLTGTIAFYNGSTIFCVIPANLQSGSNTCPPQSGFFPAGTNTVTAAYSGDANHQPSTSNGIVVTVLKDPTTAIVTSSINPSSFGQAVALNASVQGNYAPADGVVTFMDGNQMLGAATLTSSGNATLSIATLAVGSHAITAVYAGSTNFNPVTSLVDTQVVLALVVSLQPTVSLASSINPAAPAQPVVFTASVSLSGSSVSAGIVTFLDGTTVIGTGALGPGGVATFTTSTLAPGSHAITAFFTGNPAPSNPILLPATSAVLIQIITTPVVPPAASFTLTVNPSPVSVGVGRAAVLLVTIKTSTSFVQAVALTCANLPPESTCTFVQPTIPAGGGATTLQVFTTAPHDCGSTTPYFLGDLRAPGSPLRRSLPFGLPALVASAFLAGRKRFRHLRRLSLLALALTTSLSALSLLFGCGHCTDLGTRPATYTFRVIATPQGAGTVTAQTQSVALTVTIP